MFLGLGLGDLSGLADPQMWNSYAYARNNPYANIDPDGEKFWNVVKNLALSFVMAPVNFVTDPYVQQGMKLATSIVPGVSDLRDAAEVVSGQNVMTGERLSVPERVVTVAAALAPVASGSAVRGVVDAASNAVRRYSVDNVTVKGFGEIIHQGSRSLDSTINGIRSGELRGGRYLNKEGLLPSGQGYRKYDVTDTPGWDYSKVRSPERIVVGDDGRTWYTGDHYETFTEIE